MCVSLYSENYKRLLKVKKDWRTRVVDHVYELEFSMLVRFLFPPNSSVDSTKSPADFLLLLSFIWFLSYVENKETQSRQFKVGWLTLLDFNTYYTYYSKYTYYKALVYLL